MQSYSYGTDVIKKGDSFSDASKKECDAAMRDTSAFREGLVVKSDAGWQTVHSPSHTVSYTKDDID